MQDELTVALSRLDIDHVAGTDDLTDLGNRPAAGPGPFHAVERQDADCPFFAHITAGLASRLQADTRGLIADFQHHSQAPGRHIRQSLHFRKFDSPVAPNIDLADRAAPTLRFIETNQAFGEGLARQYLQFGVERGPDGKTALVEILLAVALIKIAADFLGEIF